MSNPSSVQNEWGRLSGIPVGDLILRVVGTEHHGRRIPITSNFCPIGSASSCRVRLLAPGIREVHCVLLRGEETCIVRSRAKDTYLNGQSFHEAPLRDGDRLTLGGLEFEVELTGADSSQSTWEEATPWTTSEQADGIAQAYAQFQLQVETLELQDQAQRIYVAEARQKLAQLNEVESERQSLGAQLQQVQAELAVRDQRIEQLEELVASEDRLRESNSAQAHQLEERNTLLTHEKSALTEKVDQLNRLLQVEQEGKQKLTIQFENVSAELNEAKASVNDLREELQRNRDEHRIACQEWHRDREQLERRVAEANLSPSQPLDGSSANDLLLEKAANTIERLELRQQQLQQQLRQTMAPSTGQQAETGSKPAWGRREGESLRGYLDRMIQGVGQYLESQDL